MERGAERKEKIKGRAEEGGEGIRQGHTVSGTGRDIDWEGGEEGASEG